MLEFLLVSGLVYLTGFKFTPKAIEEERQKQTTPQACICFPIGYCMTSSSEVISSLISTRDITIMQAFSVLYCTAIVHTESARANATKLCVVNVGLTTVRLVDAVLQKSEDCNPQYLMSQLAKCYLTKFALEFRRSSATPEINIES